MSPRRRSGLRRPRRRKTSALVGAALLTVLATGGCSGGSGRSGEASPTTEPAAGSTSATGTPPPAAADPAHPDRRGCYRLSYDQALAPTTHRKAVPCDRPHTATTFLVGDLDTVVDGHLLAVDARRVQARVAATCPRRLPGFLGATPDQMRLTSLRPVWFSPTLAQSDAGQNWFRCDVIALAADGRLAEVTGRLEGALSTEQGRREFGICGTSQPGRPDFERVICSAPHAWRAIASYDGTGDRYPGAAALQATAQTRCKNVARAQAADPLDFEWGYDWPTREQWRSGQRWGLCWAPDA